MFKKGDVVRVWSLQSFYGGGFLDGVEGVVTQDQHGRSVLVAVPRNILGVTTIDPSYEVYDRQLELVRHGNNEAVFRFNQFLQELKTNNRSHP